MGTLRREAVRPEMATAMARNPGRRDVEDWGAGLLRHTGVSWLYLCVCCVILIKYTGRALRGLCTVALVTRDADGFGFITIRSNYIIVLDESRRR